MGNKNGGDAHQFLYSLQFDSHFDSKLRVQVAQRFIKEKQIRFDDQGPGEGNPLLFPSGELGGISEILPRQANKFQASLHLLFDGRLVHLPDLQTKGKILLYRQMGEEGIVLKDHPHLSFKRGNIGDAFPLNINLP